MVTRDLPHHRLVAQLPSAPNGGRREGSTRSPTVPSGLPQKSHDGGPLMTLGFLCIFRLAIVYTQESDWPAISFL